MSEVTVLRKNFFTEADKIYYNPVITLYCQQMFTRDVKNWSWILLLTEILMISDFWYPIQTLIKSAKIDEINENKWLFFIFFPWNVLTLEEHADKYFSVKTCYDKCPKISNTLLHTFFGKTLLLYTVKKCISQQTCMYGTHMDRIWAFIRFGSYMASYRLFLPI